jgi:hypothetical protein
VHFSTEYHNSRQNTIILFWKYLVDIRSVDWLKSILGMHKWKIVCSAPLMKARLCYTISQKLTYRGVAALLFEGEVDIAWTN